MIRARGGCCTVVVWLDFHVTGVAYYWCYIQNVFSCRSNASRACVRLGRFLLHCSTFQSLKNEKEESLFMFPIVPPPSHSLSVSYTLPTLSYSVNVAYPIPYAGCCKTNTLILGDPRAGLLSGTAAAAAPKCYKRRNKPHILHIQLQTSIKFK